MSVEFGDVVQTLDRLKYENIVKTKDVNKVFRQVMKPVKQRVQSAAKQAIPHDPRKSWKAVRVITLKKGAGAVVGLLNPRKAGKKSTYQKPRGGKSGILRDRRKSQRTVTVESYQGADRAWLLRIVNLGNFKSRRLAGKRGTLKTEADRGDIIGKHFFRAVEAPMKAAERELAKELGNLIKKVSQ